MSKVKLYYKIDVDGNEINDFINRTNRNGYYDGLDKEDIDRIIKQDKETVKEFAQNFSVQYDDDTDKTNMKSHSTHHWYHVRIVNKKTKQSIEELIGLPVLNPDASEMNLYQALSAFNQYGYPAEDLGDIVDNPIEHEKMRDKIYNMIPERMLLIMGFSF